jgi:lysophospholipase L1-like esterase
LRFGRYLWICGLRFLPGAETADEQKRQTAFSRAGEKSMRRIVFVALFAASFGAGAIVQKYKLYPLQPVRAVRDAILGNLLDRFPADTAPKPRNSIFEAFHPHADIVMIGDSITQQAEWKEIFPASSIANRGIDFDRSYDILRRIPTALKVKPKKAFVMFGITDFVDFRTVDSVFANYQRVIEQLEAAHVQVYIQSTLECSRTTCEQMLDKVRMLNAKLQSYANDKAIPFIDINRGMTSAEDGLLKQYTFDGIHLIGSGYVEWRKAIEPHINSQASRID